jgi:hypothetical protein
MVLANPVGSMGSAQWLLHHKSAPYRRLGGMLRHVGDRPGVSRVELTGSGVPCTLQNHVAGYLSFRARIQ